MTVASLAQCATGWLIGAVVFGFEGGAAVAGGGGPASGDASRGSFAPGGPRGNLIVRLA